MSKVISVWQQDIHEWAVSKGWWEGWTFNPPGLVAEKLLLIHSEVSEAAEDFRNDQMEVRILDGTGNKPEGFPTEMADIAIRLMDLCEALHIDLDEEINRKMKFNQTRPYRHGGKRA